MPKRCDICGQSLPKGGKLYCHTCWEECMKREKMASMGVIVDRREDIWFLRFPQRIREIEADFD